MTPAAAQPKFIPDIVEEHFDELQFLWSQRRLALQSPAYRARELRLLDERIQARIDGMLGVGDAVLEFVEPGLVGEDELPALAAAMVSLRLGSSGVDGRVLKAFTEATDKKLAGLREGLAHSPRAASHGSQLLALFEKGTPSLGAAASEVLAFHGLIAPSAPQLERFVVAEDAAARTTGWRTIANCATTVPGPWFDTALTDGDAGVKAAAVRAAAWVSPPVLDGYVKSVVNAPKPDDMVAFLLFAAAAKPEEYRIIEALAANEELGPARFRIVAAYGHPYFVDGLIKEMSNSDPAVAAAAGAAFFKMTAQDVESDTKAKVGEDGKPPADEFEAEFADEVFLPNPDLARKTWKELGPTLGGAQRICRGMDMSQQLSRERFALLDMESRSEYCLRMRLYRNWKGTPLLLERFPQRG